MDSEKQNAAMVELEYNGFRFSNWVSGESEGEVCAVMIKTLGRFGHYYCEVAPDGYCDGKPIAEFLAEQS